MKNNQLFLAFICSLILLPGLFNVVKGQYFVEEFETVATMPGWVIKNNSFPMGPQTWSQGNTNIFDGYSGSGYICANFYSTVDPGNNGTISNWLISPAVIFSNGDVITFYTRKTDSATDNFADRMQVRLSLAGSSINAGVTANSVGDFTFIIKDINPTYSKAGYPIGYPYTWKRYDLTISTLTAPTQGRFAFRYFVENAGTTGNADYIGVDSVAFHASIVGIGDVVAPLDFSIYPNPVKDVMYIECNSNIHSVKVTDILGNTIENVSPEIAKSQLNTANYSPGIYFITVQTNKGVVTRKISVVK